MTPVTVQKFKVAIASEAPDFSYLAVDNLPLHSHSGTVLGYASCTMGPVLEQVTIKFDRVNVGEHETRVMFVSLTRKDLADEFYQHKYNVTETFKSILYQALDF